MTFAALFFVVCPAAMGASWAELAAAGNVAGMATFAAIFQSGWFVESMWSQTLVIHMLRSPRLPSPRDHAAPALCMLTVLGLMRITREDHCLFLLDEPDTHLNPIWKLRYFDDIEGVLASDEGALVQGESQILITTHDPMMIGSLKREQVHILRRDKGRSIVDTPDEHPQGMGVTGLLKSELFGLSSTLDIETERRLFRRNELFVKSPRSPEEDTELSRLSTELADLGFSTADFRDPDYALFVRKMAQHRRFRKPTLTPEEQAEQDAIADSIIDEILREEEDQ